MSTQCETPGVSPAKLMFKRPIQTRFDLLQPSTAEQVLAKQQAMKERYDGSTKERTFAPEDKVYTKLGFDKEWTGATVKDFNGQIIGLELSGGRRCRRHLDNILRRREPVEPSEVENNHTSPDAEATHQSVEEELTEPNTVPVMNESAENAPLRRSTRSRQPVERYQAV